MIQLKIKVMEETTVKQTRGIKGERKSLSKTNDEQIAFVNGLKAVDEIKENKEETQEEIVALDYEYIGKIVLDTIYNTLAGKKGKYFINIVINSIKYKIQLSDVINHMPEEVNGKMIIPVPLNEWIVVENDDDSEEN